MVLGRWRGGGRLLIDLRTHAGKSGPDFFYTFPIEGEYRRSGQPSPGTDFFYTPLLSIGDIEEHAPNVSLKTPRTIEVPTKTNKTTDFMQTRVKQPASPVHRLPPSQDSQGAAAVRKATTGRYTMTVQFKWGYGLSFHKSNDLRCAFPLTFFSGYNRLLT